MTANTMRDPLAIKEAARNFAMDEYFKARPQLLRTRHEEYLFEAGFDRAGQAAQSEPVVERPDCGTCANLGRVNGLSQETFCEHCSWSEKWRKNHYKPIAMQERQS